MTEPKIDDTPEPTPAESAPEPKPKATRKPKSDPTATKAPEGTLEKIDTGKHYEDILLPTEEDDPHWDPKLRNPVPDELVESLADLGWDASSQAIAIREDKTTKIIIGKTRWRAVPRANALRKKAGLPPIIAHVLVVEEADAEASVLNMQRNVALNYSVQKIDPMTTAESIVRMLSADVDEKTTAKRHAMSVNDLHGYLMLTNEDQCPPKVQELLREGLISYGAAIELARKSESMTRGEMTAAAEQIAKVAAGGVKITAAQVKKAAGMGDQNPATQKEKKQLILNLQSSKFAGKHGEAVKWAGIVCMEVGLGTRTVDDAIEALDKISKGSFPRVDFKQYQIDGKDKHVKG